MLKTQQLMLLYSNEKSLTAKIYHEIAFVFFQREVVVSSELKSEPQIIISIAIKNPLSNNLLRTKKKKKQFKFTSYVDKYTRRYLLQFFSVMGLFIKDVWGGGGTKSDEGMGYNEKTHVRTKKKIIFY